MLAHEFFIEEKPVFKERIRFGIDKTQQDGILGKVTWAMVWKFNFVGMASGGGGYQPQHGACHDCMGDHIGMLRSIKR